MMNKKEIHPQIFLHNKSHSYDHLGRTSLE